MAVRSSSGSGPVDLAAVNTVRRWRYRPALRSGRPVPAIEDLAIAVGEAFRDETNR